MHAFNIYDTKREFLTSQVFLCRRLLEKSEKIEASIMALKSQGMDDNSTAIEELEEMMTDQERQQ